MTMKMNLIEDVLSIHSKCIVSAIAPKLSVSTYTLVQTFYLVLVHGARAQSLSTPSSCVLYKTDTGNTMKLQNH
jgi:hypothetical protein